MTNTPIINAPPAGISAVILTLECLFEGHMKNYRQAWQTLCNIHGITLTKSDLDLMERQTDFQNFTNLSRNHEFLHLTDWATFQKQLIIAYDQTKIKNTRLRENIFPFLDALKKNEVKIIIASTHPETLVESILASPLLINYAPKIFTPNGYTGTNARHKMYEKITKELEALNISIDSVAIVSTSRTGIRDALDAGIYNATYLQSSSHRAAPEGTRKTVRSLEGIWAEPPKTIDPILIEAGVNLGTSRI